MTTKLEFWYQRDVSENFKQVYVRYNHVDSVPSVGDVVELREDAAEVVRRQWSFDHTDTGKPICRLWLVKFRNRRIVLR